MDQVALVKKAVRGMLTSALYLYWKGAHENGVRVVMLPYVDHRDFEFRVADRDGHEYLVSVTVSVEPIS
jgi:hypothetical protein